MSLQMNSEDRNTNVCVCSVALWSICMSVCLHTKQQVSRHCSFSKPILVCASLLFRYSSRSCVQLVLQHLNCKHMINLTSAKFWLQNRDYRSKAMGLRGFV